MKTLPEIQAEVRRLGSLIGAPETQIPTYGYSEDFARPHIEVDQRGYHYVVVERGRELERFTTRDFDELLYHIFKSVAAELSLSYVLDQRVEGQDSRRLAFQRRIDLLSVLSPKWAGRYKRELEQILREHPFDDSGSARADLEKQIRDQGQSPDDARQLAREVYSLPQAERLPPTLKIDRASFYSPGGEVSNVMPGNKDGFEFVVFHYRTALEENSRSQAVVAIKTTLPVPAASFASGTGLSFEKVGEWVLVFEPQRKIGTDRLPDFIEKVFMLWEKSEHFWKQTIH